MRKLSMAAVLPLVHFVVSIGMVGWPLLTLAEPSRKIMLWFALNGPVLLLIDLAKRIFCDALGITLHTTHHGR